MLVSGARFSFGGSNWSISSLSVETPTAEVVDMTGIQDDKRSCVLVPTGVMTGGSVTVDFYGTVDPQGLVGTRDNLNLFSQNLSIRRNAILEKANLDVRTGEAVRGTLTFRLTDYYGY